MQFDSYIISETKTAFSIPLTKVLIRKKTFKQKAFTLAETLITLSIIGVIAAMTVPTLMSNMNKQIYVTGLKKAYNQLQNAIRMIPVSQGCSGGDYVCAGFPETFWEEGDAERIVDLLSEQYKVKKVCYKKTNEGCNWNKDASIFPGFMVEDGSEIFVTRSSTLGIKVDINGEKGPNENGRDIFDFLIVTEYSMAGEVTNVPVGTVAPGGSRLAADAFQQADWAYWKNSPKCYGSETGGWNLCAGRVLETGKMDY